MEYKTMEGAIHQALEKILPEILEDEQPVGALESVEGNKKRRMAQVQDWLAQYGTRFTKGMNYFTQDSSLLCREKLLKYYTDEGLDLIFQYFDGDDFCLGNPLDLEGKDYEALYEIATKAFETDPQLAFDLYTTLACLNYTFPEFVIGMALSALKCGDTVEAERLFKLALVINPDHPDPYFFYGNYMASVGDSRAELLLEQAKMLKDSTS